MFTRKLTLYTGMAAACFLIIVSLFANMLPGTFELTASAATTKTVRQGMFYDRPKDESSVSATAQRAKMIVLTRGNWRYLNDLRNNGFSGIGLQYFLANEVSGPGPLANSSAWCDSNFTPQNNVVAYNKGDFCKYIHPNESWFLHNSQGKRLYKTKSSGVYYQMNPASEGWRNFARSRMVRDIFGDSSQAKIGFDGIYLDNLGVKIYKLQKQLSNSDGTVKEYSSDSAYRNANIGYVSYLGEKLRSGSKLYANIIDDWAVAKSDYLTVTDKLDGYLNEAWALGYVGRDTSADRWSEYLSIAETTLSQGKGLFAVVQGDRYNYTRQQFGLASYLLITNNTDRAVIRYADYSKYPEWWSYDNYNVSLGAPKGKRYQQGSTWRRDFECGYVTADPNARTGKIVTTSCTSTAEVPASLSVQLKGVSDGQTVNGTINVEAVVSASTTIKQVEFFSASTSITLERYGPYFLGGDNNGAPKGYDTRQLPNGSRVLKAVVTDANGRTASTQITITVNN